MCGKRQRSTCVGIVSLMQRYFLKITNNYILLCKYINVSLYAVLSPGLLFAGRFFCRKSMHFVPDACRTDIEGLRFDFIWNPLQPYGKSASHVT